MFIAVNSGFHYLEPIPIGRTLLGFQTTHSGADLGHTGFGLVGIVERAQLLGGTAVVQSEPGLGTSIRIEIKLKDIPNGR